MPFGKKEELKNKPQPEAARVVDFFLEHKGALVAVRATEWDDAAWTISIQHRYPESEFIREVVNLIFKRGESPTLLEILDTIDVFEQELFESIVGITGGEVK